jgi:hypothetical protein
VRKSGIRDQDEPGQAQNQLLVTLSDQIGRTIQLELPAPYSGLDCSLVDGEVMDRQYAISFDGNLDVLVEIIFDVDYPVISIALVFQLVIACQNYWRCTFNAIVV